MIRIFMNNVKSKIEGINTLMPSIIDQICYKCSYQKIGFGVKPRQYLINPYNGITYTGLIPSIINILKQYHIQYEVNDLRECPQQQYNWHLKDEIVLRDYQARIVDSCHSREVIQACTSAGKTIIMASLIVKFGVNTLVIAPNVSLAYQLRDEFKDLLNIHIGIVTGVDIDINSPIIVGTPQTLMNYKFLLARTKALFIDEFHHQPSNTIFNLSINCHNAYYRIGCSASPFRDDGTDILMTAAFVQRDPSKIIMASELIRKNVLIPVDITYFKSAYVCSENNYASIYNNNIVNNNVRNNKIISLVKKHSNQTIVILYKAAQHGEYLLKRLKDEMPNTNFVYKYNNQLYYLNTIELCDGKTPLDRRNAVFQATRENKVKILLGSSILDEGISINTLQVLILAGGGKSSTRAFQRVGRVLRKCPGKDRAYVYDFIDCYNYPNCLTEHSKIRYELLRLEPEFHQVIAEM